MNSDLITLITAARQKVLNTIMLVEASLSRITHYDVNQNYTPEEMEPYDAMSGRFIRAIEVSLKFLEPMSVICLSKVRIPFETYLTGWQRWI